MAALAVAHLYTFSYVPFTVDGQRARLMQAVEALMETEGEAPRRKGRRSGKKSDRGEEEEEGGDEVKDGVGGDAEASKGVVGGRGGAAGGGGSSPAPRGTLALFFERHFAGRSAVRDFNASMPVVVLPSDFSPAKGVVVDSRPGDRVPVLEPLDPRSDDAVADLM